MSVARARFAFTGDFEPGTIDASALGNSLMALSELCQAANDRLNGERARAVVRVRANFRAASFDVFYELVQSLSDQIRTLVGMKPAIVGPAEILSILGLSGVLARQTALSVLKLVKQWQDVKQEPDATLKVDSNGLVELTIAGKVTKVHHHVLELAKDRRVRRALPGVLSPLRLPSVRALEIRPVSRRSRKAIEVISKDDVPALEEPVELAPPVERDLHQGERTAILQIVKPALIGDYEWQLSEGEGGSVFSAPVEDADFISRRDAGEPFRAGDFLKVRLHSKSIEAPSGRLVLKQRVIKVLEHIQRRDPHQLTLPSPPLPPTKKLK